MTDSTTHDRVLVTDYQKDVAAYWNAKTADPVNLVLGQRDGLYHHHYGIGPYDPSVLDAGEGREERIADELHRMETTQADLLLDALGDVDAGERVLDAGSGRGGTSFMAHERFGCRVDGVSISEYQVQFCRDLAASRGTGDAVQFHFRNMLDTGLPEAGFRAIWTNETTMYVDLFDLYGELARLLRPGGRYVCITGCYNDVRGGPSAAVQAIDEHYVCRIHPRSAYFQALAANDLVPISVVDLTADTISYWELRAESSLRTGIEDAFLAAYRDGSFHYLLIAADRGR